MDKNKAYNLEKKKIDKIQIMSHEIVLISVGILQTYIFENIENLFLFGNQKITIITHREFENEFNDFLSRKPHIFLNIIFCEELFDHFFDKKNIYMSQSKDFRNDFYSNTSKRFFYLYDYMVKYNKSSIFHIENDYMLYEKIDVIYEKIGDQKNKLWITMDHPHRCIPGILYIPDIQILSQFIKNYQFQKTDMENFAEFYHKNKDLCCQFPIFPANEHFSRFRSLFDAAAIGQYLFGIDPRNVESSDKPIETIGFRNETCIYPYWEYTFHWIKNENHLYSPHILVNIFYIKINGLHIHSKDLYYVHGDYPMENEYIKKSIKKLPISK